MILLLLMNSLDLSWCTIAPKIFMQISQFMTLNDTLNALMNK